MAVSRLSFRHLVPALVCLPLVALAASPAAAEPAVAIPAPTRDATAPADAGLQRIVLAGGCFWGVQAVFQHTKGVTSAVSGYAGGDKHTAHYEMVGTGRTGHAESVAVTFDPKQISYGKILQIYFSVAHDPTELNYQGPDHGTQYRSAIFYANDEQKRVAEAISPQLDKAHAFGEPIVTKLEPLKGFYRGGGLSSGFRRAAPELSLHRVQRCAEGGEPQAAVRRRLSRHPGHGDGREQGGGVDFLFVIPGCSTWLGPGMTSVRHSRL